MPDTYPFMSTPTGADQYKKNGQDDAAAQNSKLFQALIQQTMQGGGMNNGSGLGAAMSGLSSGLGTYLMMQQQQPYSTDPTSANFMGPPTTLMNGFGGS